MSSKDYRSSESGKFVSRKFADENKSTTTGETRTKRKKKIKTVPDFAERLEAAVVGLTLTSESDAPLVIRPNSWIRAMSFEDFCERLSGENRETFCALIEGNLTNISVIYCGSVQKQVVLFGNDETGRLHCITSLAIET